MEGLLTKLEGHKNSDVYPFHMPGHKRNSEILGNTLPYGIDITEITGFDNLHGADGIIDDIQARLSRFYGSVKSFLLVNGSTCGIMSAILSACDFGDKIIVARNCHKSVYNAIELYNLRPVWILPERDECIDTFGEVKSSDIENAIMQNPDARLVVITSPTYEGVISNIPQIAKLCHSRGILLFVDMAHGAHLPLFEGFENAYGADISVVSLHKTLPCMTQTACLNIHSEKVDTKKLSKLLSCFETSSPSYPLMASVDRCMKLIEERGRELTENYERMLGDFYDRAFRLKALRLHRTDDFGKLVIACDKASINGSELFARLRDEYGIECEMASARYVIAMSSICDTQEGFDRLIKALFEIDGGLEHRQKELPVSITLPKAEMTSYEAARRESKQLSLDSAVGRICASYVWTYPPGIPLIAPGEVITQDIADKISELSVSGVEIHTDCGGAIVSVLK